MDLSVGSGAGVDIGSIKTNCVKLSSTVSAPVGHIIVTMGIEMGIDTSEERTTLLNFY